MTPWTDRGARPRRTGARAAAPASQRPAQADPSAAGPGEGAPFDPPADLLRDWLEAAGGLLSEHLDGLADRPLHRDADPSALIELLRADRPGQAVSIDEALATIAEVVAAGDETASGNELGYIPGSGMASAAVAELLAAGLNRYTGLPGLAPAAVALESSVLDWLTETFALPPTAQGVLTSGGSMANLIGLLAARDRADVDLRSATVYVGEHAHASVRKAARLAGLRGEHVRGCASADGLRLDPDDVAARIAEDRAAGREPMAIVAAAGTTNAGAIDPLGALADLAATEGVWLHVDAAYGGFFQLTGAGRARLAGIERADSITLDPHKSLFLPFGTGAVLVRDAADLTRTFAEDADYLRDLDDGDALPDLSAMTPELTRAWRGLRLWLPLKLHGLAAFQRALDERLAFAERVHRVLAADPRVRTYGPPDLTVVAFRADGDDALQDRLLDEIHADGTVRLSSTRIDGQVVLRVALLSHRTSAATVEGVIARIRGALDRCLGPAGAAG